MTLADLAGRLIRTTDVKVRWNTCESSWRSTDRNQTIFDCQCRTTSRTPIADNRWEAFLAALAAFRKHGVYLCAHDLEAV